MFLYSKSFILCMFVPSYKGKCICSWHKKKKYDFKTKINVAIDGISWLIKMGNIHEFNGHKNLFL